MNLTVRYGTVSQVPTQLFRAIYLSDVELSLYKQVRFDVSKIYALSAAYSFQLPLLIVNFTRPVPLIQHIVFRVQTFQSCIANTVNMASILPQHPGLLPYFLLYVSSKHTFPLAHYV